MNHIRSFFDNSSIAFQPLALVFARLYVASVFLTSGAHKISHWDATLYLFEYEYQVPSLPAQWAAVMGTGAEIIFPLLLIIGLLTRMSALALFMVNIVAVISYPVITNGSFSFIMAFDMFPVGFGFPTKGFESHVVWGILLMIVMAFGAGKVSIDYFFSKKMKPNDDTDRIPL